MGIKKTSVSLSEETITYLKGLSTSVIGQENLSAAIEIAARQLMQQDYLKMGIKHERSNDDTFDNDDETSLRR